MRRRQAAVQGGIAVQIAAKPVLAYMLARLAWALEWRQPSYQLLEQRMKHVIVKQVRGAISTRSRLPVVFGGSVASGHGRTGGRVGDR